MHLTFAASGIKHEMEFMEKFLETRSFVLPYKDNEGNDKFVAMQSQLRPIQLYDFIFPRDSLDIVLNTLKPETGKIQGFNVSGFSTILTGLRKAMKLKKIPKPDEKKGVFAYPSEKLKDIRFVGIGIREDRDVTFKNGFIHEAI